MAYGTTHPFRMPLSYLTAFGRGAGKAVVIRPEEPALPVVDKELPRDFPVLRYLAGSMDVLLYMDKMTGRFGLRGPEGSGVYRRYDVEALCSE